MFDRITKIKRRYKKEVELLKRALGGPFPLRPPPYCRRSPRRSVLASLPLQWRPRSHCSSPSKGGVAGCQDGCPPHDPAIDGAFEKGGGRPEGFVKRWDGHQSFDGQMGI